MVEKVNKAPLTFEKRAALAHALENTHQRIKTVEAINPSSIGYKHMADLKLGELLEHPKDLNTIV